MSIDPNKAFGMKATNVSYTLEFRRSENGTTELSAVDMETPKMSFGRRLKAAWNILTGAKTIGDYVFPIRLRNSDFYHLSFIYRPEKEPKVIEKIVEKIVEVPAKPVGVKEAATETTAKPAKSSKPKAPRKPKTEKPA